MIENYLKTALESATARDLVFYDLKEFLTSCGCKNITTFMKKWEKYDVQMEKISIAYGKGNWTPTSSELEIKKQVPWKYFVVGYDKEFGSCSIKNEEDDGRDYQPLNFEELVQMTFWESIYSVFGHKVMKFIFDKCILIFTIEPEIFLIISSTKCCIPLNPSRRKIAITTTNNGKAIFCKPRKRFETDSLPKPKPTLVTKGRSTFNKVEIKTVIVQHQKIVDEGPTTSEKITCNSVLKTVLVGDSSPSNTMITNSNSISVNPGLKRKGDSISSKSDVPSKRTKSGADKNAIVRWVTPKGEVLESIISERDKNKQKQNISSCLPVNSVDRTEYGVVAILKDSYFKDKGIPLDIIGKITFPINRLPSEYEGLRLPKDLISNGQCFMCAVYRMSETEAKKRKIRIKPRKRKSKEKPVTDVAFGIADQEIREINGSDSSSDCNVDFSRYFSYNPYKILPTDEILYNKSSWSKLPSSHFARRIVSMNEESGINVLMAEILGVEENLYHQIVKSKLWDELRELRNIATTVVSFHKKVKDIHKIIKNCLRHSLVNYIQKLMLKATKKIHRKNYRYLNQKPHKMKLPQNLTRSSIICSDNLIEVVKPTLDPSSSSLESEKSQNSPPCCIPLNLRHLSQFFPSDSDGCSKSLSHISNALSQSKVEIQKKSKTMVFQNLKQAIPHICILSTLSHILHLSGADRFISSRRNKRGFISFVKKSIMMGGKHCSLQLGLLMESLHQEDCSWAKQIENENIRRSIFSSVVQWLFRNYVLAFMKTSFYATEASNSRNSCVFYLREAWKSVTDKVKDRYLKKKSLRRISVTKAKDKVQPSAMLRLLPKSNNGIRTLISIKKSMHSTLNHKDCRHLLHYLNSKLCPQGIQDPNGIRAKWSAFYQSRSNSKNVPLYYVRADIMDAYPSVDLKLLKDILIRSFYENGDFTLKTYRVTSVSSPKVPKVRYSLLNRNNRTNWHSEIFTRPCIIEDTKSAKTLNAQDIILHLVKALEPSVLSLGQHKFEFENGLPQGWIISPYLCNLYYGCMEEIHLSEFIGRPGELFLRNVDDYFYVSSDPHRIKKFCEKMKNGIEEYNCKLNLTKFTSNVDVSSTVRMPMTICDWVSFCGWKFCLTTGHVCRDFSSYKGLDISSAVSFRMSDKTNSDLFIMSRMGTVIPLRLSSLLFDPVVNCRRRIIMNIFEAALMFAFRFYAICRVVYPNSKFATTGTRINTLTSAVHKAAMTVTRHVVRGNEYLYASRPVHHCNLENHKESCQRLFKYPRCKLQILPSAEVPMYTSTPKEDIPASSISHPEVVFLVYHAFILKLSKHSGIFKDSLLPILKKVRSNQRAKFSEGNYNFLMETVGCKMPECFLAIKK